MRFSPSALAAFAGLKQDLLKWTCFCCLLVNRLVGCYWCCKFILFVPILNMRWVTSHFAWLEGCVKITMTNSDAIRMFSTHCNFGHCGLGGSSISTCRLKASADQQWTPVQTSGFLCKTLNLRMTSECCRLLPGWFDMSRSRLLRCGRRHSGKSLMVPWSSEQIVGRSSMPWKHGYWAIWRERFWVFSVTLISKKWPGNSDLSGDTQSFVIPLFWDASSAASWKSRVCIAYPLSCLC